MPLQPHIIVPILDAIDDQTLRSRHTLLVNFPSQRLALLCIRSTPPEATTRLFTYQELNDVISPSPAAAVSVHSAHDSAGIAAVHVHHRWQRYSRIQW